MALVSLRESQLRDAGDRGRRGQRVAALASDPNRFLAAVQIGVTLAGFLSAAFGAATLADELAPVLEGWGLPHGLSTARRAGRRSRWSSPTSSLVLGELAPKRIALQRAEGWRCWPRPPSTGSPGSSRPVIWLLSRSTDVVVRLLGGDPTAGREQISDEELRGAGHRPRVARPRGARSSSRTSSRPATASCAR